MKSRTSRCEMPMRRKSSWAAAAHAHSAIDAARGKRRRQKALGVARWRVHVCGAHSFGRKPQRSSRRV
eukprot:4388151-Prymnesium_polylepis.1